MTDLNEKYGPDFANLSDEDKAYLMWVVQVLVGYRNDYFKMNEETRKATLRTLRSVVGSMVRIVTTEEEPEKTSMRCTRFVKEMSKIRRTGLK